MREEVDYSQEAKYDLFESVAKERLANAACVISRTRPSYEDVKEELSKKDMSISKKDYEKICDQLGLS